MRVIADFHVHSKYSRATSPRMDLENLLLWSKYKGIGIIATGDWTHPFWFNELKKKLEPAAPGLYKLKKEFFNNVARLNPLFFSLSKEDIYFILTTEVSSIYSQKGKVRKIHTIIFAPDIDTVEKINKKLGSIGNLYSDGRPILGVSAKDLAKICLDINERCLIVPAHAWTPWFSVFGSNSGFDSLEECYEEITPYIYSIETGLSSDPEMNWRLSALDRITLISNSDSHSPEKIGREANVFELSNLSYDEIYNIIKNKDRKKFLYTIEFFPQEGKYHWDGHRSCNISLPPRETIKLGGKCPKCGRPLTIGVEYRVEELADREEGFRPANAVDSLHLVPLEEIIAQALGVASTSLKVKNEYMNLISRLGSEFFIFLDLKDEELDQSGLPEGIIRGIKNVKNKKVKAIPGYDGVYGIIDVMGEGGKGEKSSETEKKEQGRLF